MLSYTYISLSFPASSSPTSALKLLRSATASVRPETPSLQFMRLSQTTTLPFGAVPLDKLQARVTGYTQDCLLF